MTASFDICPHIFGILNRYEPTHCNGRPAIKIERPCSVNIEYMEEIARELQSDEVMAQLESAEVATLAVVAANCLQRCGDDAGVSIGLQAVLSSRPGELDADIALIAISDFGVNRDILKVFTGMTKSAAMIDAIIEAALLKKAPLAGWLNRFDVNALVIRDKNQARRALPAVEFLKEDLVPTVLVAAMARGLGWTPWVKLFAILYDEVELALEVKSTVPARRQYDNEDTLAMRRAAWENILPDTSVREVARLILDLGGALSSSGPDVRAVYVQRLRNAIGIEPELRRAALEALLSRCPPQQHDLALFAATRFVEADDATFIGALIDHPDREVGYRADMVRHAVFDKSDGDEVWPTPGVSTISGGLFSIRLNPVSSEHSHTWIGDRLIELLIEQTVAGEEKRFSQQYQDHSEEGEEGLLRSFFSDLAYRLRDLGDSLRATARATGSSRVTSIDLNYRPVDKSEEGKPGVSPRGDLAPPSFSADLCLIVDPYLEGRPLGKRATLVQAKRLRRKDTTRPEKGLASSFRLEPGQMSDLLRQTGSSFYLFQCPGLLDRGIPIVPTQLVEDLARFNSGSASQLPTDLVGPASRPFAEWLTYMVLGLRTGDPFAELVAKAEGADGRRPRPLASFGTVEIVVRVNDIKPRDG
ncbi:hypothetical protein SAMN05444413_12048 [Roseivivax marinus]|uniref:hypothetical protein n=1 Tax=Roseivivax marinus TaxID=1379903 RepID=UPI0008B9F604|nr:hypothetical protein [Roseivivax marinus]SEL89514.1 hypothetical protein SAMN05444413_12048 [Roseivivax marinus]